MLMRSEQMDLRTRLRHLDEVDWDFASSRSQSAFSSIHWHPCRYPSQIPSVLIGALSDPGERVLDPFLGSGTTAVEAQRLDRSSIGIELNPVAVLMSRAKTLSHDAKYVRRLVERIIIGCRQTTTRDDVPDSVQGSKWYTQRTLNSLRRIRSYIGGLRGDGRLLAGAAFSAILLPACRETRHWGYVCDNTAPKADNERDVFELFETALGDFVKAYDERDYFRNSSRRTPGPLKSVEIIQGDSADAIDINKVGRAQLIVTSPPYFGVADYIKAQRLSLEWMETEIEPLRLREIGARSKRHRLVAADQYLSDCKRVFERCREVLEDGRACAVVFGESTDRAPMRENFEKVLKSCGFKLHYVRSRRISSGRRLAPSLQEEHLLIFA
jgi:DNA modification methylase